MFSRWLCGAAICFGLGSPAEAAESSGLVRRASCAVIRYYVAKYSAPAAEAWARSKGANDAEIEAARHCLKDTSVPTMRTAAPFGGSVTSATRRTVGTPDARSTF